MKSEEAKVGCQTEDTRPPPHCMRPSKVKENAQRAFLQATSRWGISVRHQRALLFGSPLKDGTSRKPILVFDDLLRSHELEILQRIADILDVFLLGRRVFKDDIAAALWMNAPSKELCFCDISPLTLLVYGGDDGVVRLKKHLSSMLNQTENAKPRFRTTRSELHELPLLTVFTRHSRFKQNTSQQAPRKVRL